VGYWGTSSDVNKLEGNIMNRLFVTMLVITLLLLNVPNASAQFSEAGVEKFRVAVDAPDFTLKELGGGKISFKELRGKIILLNFFASW
jgi:cytochrome oxidase Cu insertion factor (SCO1/SenC/PrrC family)